MVLNLMRDLINVRRQCSCEQAGVLRNKNVHVFCLFALIHMQLNVYALNELYGTLL